VPRRIFWLEEVDKLFKKIIDGDMQVKMEDEASVLHTETLLLRRKL
jgi:hypothetical protein